MPQAGHGPDGPLIVAPYQPPPPPAPPLALYVPAELTANLGQAQMKRVAVVELEFALAVSEQLVHAYRSILAIAREVSGDGAPEPTQPPAGVP